MVLLYFYSQFKSSCCISSDLVKYTLSKTAIDADSETNNRFPDWARLTELSAVFLNKSARRALHLRCTQYALAFLI